MTRVHQVLSGAGPYDAVTTQALLWRRLFADWGIAGGIHAEALDPRTEGVEPIAALRPAPEDLLVLRYSAYSRAMRGLLELPQRKLLVYHNVTPPRYLWNHEPAIAVRCSLGRAQLPAYARAADSAVADSAFNAGELEAAGARDVSVVPILLDPARLDRVRRDADSRDGEADGPLIICVGRLVPNKRHDLVIQAFAAWQRLHAPEARLLCAGEPISPRYADWLHGVVADCGARNVSLPGGISEKRLAAAYGDAAVLLSLSEHEGFCIPLIESFQTEVPVVARPAGAMPEVGGDAVLWTGEGAPDPAIVAELIELAVRDTGLRAELIRRGRRRLEQFGWDAGASRVRTAIDAALA